jgi:hypothetical protein
MLLKTETPSSEIPFTDYVTLQHRGFEDFGEERYRILTRLPGAKWSALRLERDRLSANFQGNPLWPHKALARYPKLSAALGLAGAFGEDVCLLPDFRTANSFLRNLGQGRFRFEAGQPATDRAYVDNFIDACILPMAPALERDSVHDWAYHFVTLLFPEYLESLRRNLDWIRAHIHRFEGSVTREWNHYGHSRDEQGSMILHSRRDTTSWEEAVYRQMAVSLDVCTAKIVQILCVDEKGLLDRCLSELKIVSVFAAGVTAESLATVLWLEPNLAKILAPPPSTGHAFRPEAMKYLRDHLENLESRCPLDARARGRAAFFAKIQTSL